MDPTVEQESADSGSVWDRATIVRVTCMAFLLTLTLSWHAYIPSLRIFALSPVIDILGSTPVWADWIILILNMGCLGWLIMKPLQRAPAVGVLICTVFWVLQDLLRFQPHTYMYVFTIVLAVFFTSRSMDALKIMVASVYFWESCEKERRVDLVNSSPEIHAGHHNLQGIHAA